ncbi:hypothetical protein DRO47_04675 [Candidatus Bathyarchaeota archaeon]|nr:MAG: hypothetical protein DRO47_04675 [Candidatus Bathyarchaeota archaeon]
MTESTRKAAIGTVIDNDAIKRRFGRLTIQLAGEAARRFSHVTPGQFAQIRLSEAALPQPDRIPDNIADSARRQILLRRPFSFCDVTVESPTEVHIGILYCVLGPATLRMTTLASGNQISIIGPLGNGFSVPAGKKLALLVAGGMGAPPLQHLARVLKSNFAEVEVVAFAGAKTLGDLPFTEQGLDKKGSAIAEFAGFCAQSHVATDDGSAGFRGFVTDCVRRWFRKNKPAAAEVIIYSCGPEPMLAETAKLAGERGIDCQVSMERMMACGIGLCQSCAVACKSGWGKTEYKLCCKDGPVFDSKDVVFLQK